MTAGTKETLAFVGLGIMGLPMATNLQKPATPFGYTTGPPPRAIPLVAKGAVACATPGEAASGASVIITMVSDTPDVVAVVAGPDGVLSGARKGSVIIDMSTISPDVTRELAAQAQEQGVDWMGRTGIAAGRRVPSKGPLTIFCGGAGRCRGAMPPGAGSHE